MHNCGVDMLVAERQSRYLRATEQHRLASQSREAQARRVLGIARLVGSAASVVGAFRRLPNAVAPSLIRPTS